MLLRFLCLCSSIAGIVADATTKPNIILLIADDMGWNDIGFHGSNEIPTPNIDALAYNGLILNRHYTQPVCTPSRAALMTSKYPIKLGLQGPPIGIGSPVSLPLNEKILPQYLKDMGYVSRLVGKWHLGFYKRECTPTARGFDSHFGYYNGWIRYNDSISTTTDDEVSGIDAWCNDQHVGDKFKNKYNTDVFTDEAVNLIKSHDIEKPLFLDLSYAAVHAIVHSDLQVRNLSENDKRFAYIKDEQRRLFAGVLSALDESVGRIIQALQDKGMLNNSIVLFTSDNGGSTVGETNNFKNTGSNWPLRGCKGSVSEGGVRSAAAIWSPLIKLHNHVSDKLIHLTDWLPTFYAAAGGNVSDLGNIDGINQWSYLTGTQSKSLRREILVNIDEVSGDESLISGNWKLVKMVKGSTVYSGSSGREDVHKYNMTNVIASQTHKIIASYTNQSEYDLKKIFWHSRNRAKIDKFCKNRMNDLTNESLKCFQKGCLFHIKNDPCEYDDLSAKHEYIYHKMQTKMDEYRKMLVKQQTSFFDPNSNPKYFENYWTPWVSSSFHSQLR